MADVPRHRHLAEFIRFAIEEMKAAGQQTALDTLERLRTSYSYRAPECQGSLWNDLFNEFLVPHIIPFDGEPWTMPIKRQWAHAMSAVNRAEAEAAEERVYARVEEESRYLEGGGLYDDVDTRVTSREIDYE